MNGLRLLVTEKPSVAAAIAQALGVTTRKDGYFEGNGYLISWCVGHLVELAPPDQYDEKYKKWNRETLPIIPTDWKYEVKPETKAQFKILRSLMNRNDVFEVCCCTDAGREGQLIFQLVYNQAGCKKQVKRLWISSMEESAIREGIQNMKPNSEYDNLYQSALCRQRADWLVGLNGTRLFTTLYGGKVLKLGRVQTPTLAMIVDRDLAIKNFEKKPYYELEAELDDFSANGLKIENQAEAETAKESCAGKTAIVTELTKEEKRINPPKLFDLTSLQKEANKLYGFTAKETLDLTQSLYEKKLVTYPRTDSQYLSDDMGDTACRVIDAIQNSMHFLFNSDSGVDTGADSTGNKSNVSKLLNSSKVSDHHAIIPTVQISKLNLETLSDDEKEILLLIASRILQATGNAHIYLLTRATLKIGEYEFTTSGKEMKDMGWKAYEEQLKAYLQLNTAKKADSADDSSESATQRLPELLRGQELDVKTLRVLQKFTKPPVHYTESSILSAMEKAGAEDTTDDAERKGLGTPATRADILEKLVRDGYIRRDKKQLIATDDGCNLIKVLPDIVKSAKLTSSWENDLSLIAKGEMDAESFMDGIVQMIKEMTGAEYQISDADKALFARTFPKHLGSYSDRLNAKSGAKNSGKTKNRSYTR